MTENVTENMTEYLDGTGTDHLVLSRRPVETVTALFEDPSREFGPDTEITSGRYSLAPRSGTVIRVEGIFRPGIRTVKVVYTYTESPDIVTRLREGLHRGCDEDGGDLCTATLLREAADEIERLRARLAEATGLLLEAAPIVAAAQGIPRDSVIAELTTLLKGAAESAQRGQAEIAALRAALKEREAGK